MALAPWEVLGGGKVQSHKALEERKENTEGLRSIVGSGDQSEDNRSKSSYDWSAFVRDSFVDALQIGVRRQ